MKLHLTRLTAALVACLGSVGCVGRVAHNLPPAQRLMEPGPGVGGPGPGVIQPASAAMAMGLGPMGGGGGPYMDGAYAAGGCGPGGCPPGGGGMVVMAGGGSSQIAFLGVEGAEVAWDISGHGGFDSSPLVMPGRQNFPQGAIYRLKLTNIPDRPGVELYPTIEVAPVTPRTDAYLAHSPIPVQFTDEDLDQVLSGNFVTKVIYLPDPEFQDLALSGVETLVSTRLDPGVDPIAEADHRGAILAILRIGNLDLQLPGQMVAMNGVEHAQYTAGQPHDGQVIDPETGMEYAGPQDGGVQYDGAEYGGADYGGAEYGHGNGGTGYGGGYCGPMGGGNGMSPMGMPTAGFAPAAMPPHLVSGVNGPQYGMPITGTPIGLPGPPHIPLGHEAGLTSHTMVNRTKVLMPPPVHNMKMTVKQRPGMNYPRPVNHVDVSEVNRAPLRLCGGTLGCCCCGFWDRMRCKLHSMKQDECGEECPPY